MIYSTMQQLSAVQDKRVTAHSLCSELGRADCSGQGRADCSGLAG